MVMPVPAYVYRARFVSLHDGDTIIIERDLGGHIYQQTSVRLLGIDTPEVVGSTKAAGLASKAFAQEWLRVGVALGGWPLVIETRLDRLDKYGRLLAKVWRVVDGHELGADLLAASMAVPFMVDRL